MDLSSSVKTSTGALAAIAAASSGAMAADLRAAPPTLAPVATWQGFYMGASVGASWLHSIQDDTAAVNGISLWSGACCETSTPYMGGAASTATALGFIGGLHLGYNWQSGNFVYGLEGDFSWLSGTASSTGSTNMSYGHLYTYPGTTARSSRVSALATFRGRFGMDFNGTMPYLTLGLAWGHINNSWSFSGNVSGNGTGYGANAASVTQTSWVPGIVIGGGLEHKLTQNWTLRGEILWVGFEDRTLGNPLVSSRYQSLTGNGGAIKFTNELTIGRVGMSYRF